MKWYILQSIAGQEGKVSEAIREKVGKEGMSDLVSEVVVPVEKIIKVMRGKKVEVEKKFLPGYILIKMKMSDSLWHVLQKIPKVGGFLGAQNKPQEVPEFEVKRITEQIETNAIERERALLFEVGDSVKVNDGPFESFVGTVEGVEDIKQRLKVSVTIFGRSTPLDLGFDQVTKEE